MKKTKLWILLGVGVGVIVASVLAWRASSRLVNAIVINIEDKSQAEFVTEKDVEHIIEQKNLCKVGLTQLDDLNLKAIEDSIKTFNFVLSCHASKDLKGNLVLDIRQNRPVARIIRPNNQSEYLAANGVTMPLSKKHTARVLVLSGEGTYKLRKDFCRVDSLGKQFFDFIRYIDSNDFWKAQITQIEINKKFEITFYTQAGNQRIEIGRSIDEAEIEKKMKKVMTFYREIVPVKGWNAYQRINVEYDKQIICE
jgi:cell division protein FtsQ